MRRKSKTNPIHHRTLLLNASWEPMRLIPERKLINYLWAGKVEIISVWDESIPWVNGTHIKWPATVRFKERKPQISTLVSFNRISLYQRDKYTCQYCWTPYTKSHLTIDHVFPDSRGGKTNWENCVTACRPCNAHKADRTPEEANMELLKKPARPTQQQLIEYFEHWHPDWKMQLGIE